MVPEVGGSKPLGHPIHGSGCGATHAAAGAATTARNAPSMSGCANSKPLDFEHARDDALTVDEQVLHELAAVDRLQREQRRREHASVGAPRAPSARVNSALVTGFGAVRLTGPDTESVVEEVADRADVVVEGDPAHVLLARADPAAEPELERQEHPVQRAAVGGEHDARCGWSTTRIPASAAGAVAASQATQTWAGKSSPGGASSVSTSAPRLP